MNNNEQIIKIVGLPRRLSIRRLSTILNRHKQAWKLEDLIPLEASLVAIIWCETKDTYDTFLKLPVKQPFSSCPEIRVYKEYSTNCYHDQQAPSSTTSSNLSNLNPDCLRHIFEHCTLQSQIALAKVCYYFYKLIMDIWRQRHETLLFSLYHFKVSHQLSDEELWDFCLLAGPYVRRLIFNSVLFFPVIQRFIADQPGNMMQNAKRYMNIILCRHLVHFAPLQVFEVQGKFLAEYTVRELARYCPQLRELQLLDAGTRWLVGEHFHLLRHVEVLNLQDCENLHRRLMRKTCRSLQLKALNIVECKEMIHVPTIRQLCPYFKSMEKLHLTALADATMLSAILRLTQLKELKFYWLNDYAQFEKVLCRELLQRRSASLCAMYFENEPVFLENASQRVWRAGEYSGMRELATINGRPWRWDECFDDWASLLSGSTTLELLHFEYCRVFTHEQILEMSHISKHLKIIRFVGCRNDNDEKLVKYWKQEGNFSCQLCIEGELPWSMVQRLRDRVTPYRKAGNWQPIYRSITCHFK